MLLAISAFDPEAWCGVIIHPGAFATAGPFREVPSPLREWLLRTAVEDPTLTTVHHFRRIIRSHINAVVFHDLGTRPHRNPKNLLAATHDAGLGPIDSDPTGAALAAPCVLQESSLPSLGPEIASKTPRWLAEYLQTLADRQFDCNLKAGPDAIALAAGVWQMNGFLDRSHELAQSVEGEEKTAPATIGTPSCTGESPITRTPNTGVDAWASMPFIIFWSAMPTTFFLAANPQMHHAGEVR